MDRVVMGLTALVAAMGLVTGAQAAKYKAIEVADGGTISGKVLLGGAEAETQAFLITKDPEVCGSGERELNWVRASGDALLDAVVYLENVEAGKAFPAEAERIVIDQKNCGFLPYLQVMVNEGDLEALNSDPVTHNIHTYELIGRARRTAINVSQSEQGGSFTKKIKLRKGVAMKVECDVHNFMHAWVFVARNPYYAVVDENGEFTITDVPPGKYVIKSWHGRLGEKEASVEVSAGGEATVSISY
jgi:hypothetical protein